MGTFIKLSNGATINSAVVGSVTPFYNNSPADNARFRIKNQDLSGDEKAVLKSNPSISLTDIHGTETVLLFDSEEARDAELSQIKSHLVPDEEPVLVMLDGKIVNPKYLAAVYVQMYRGDYQLVIKLAGLPPIIRHCKHQEEYTLMKEFREILGDKVFKKVAKPDGPAKE